MKSSCPFPRQIHARCASWRRATVGACPRTTSANRSPPATTPGRRRCSTRRCSVRPSTSSPTSPATVQPSSSGSAPAAWRCRSASAASPVHGIDLSAAMVDQLSGKPGAERVGVTIGDFATTRVEGTFRLVYLVFNTIMNLTTQDDQVACFCNAAAHLEPGGCFVIEVGVPDLRRLPPGETVRVHGQPDVRRPRRVHRPRRPDRVLPPLPGRRRQAQGVLDAVPLRVAVRARPDGAHRRAGPARALERLEPRAVHRREPSHVSVWQRTA